MSISILNQVYDEVRRLAIAGSALAPGDFRLKKLVPSLEQAGNKSPVFAKVAEAASAVIDSNDITSSSALLEFGTLINSILYTQGETGVEGPLEPIISKDFGLTKTQTSANLLKPLLEALTTKGSGRLEIIKDAHQRGLFRDFRLIRPAIVALDDGYAEIADFVANEVLTIYGKAIVPELESQFDPKGKGGQSRRLLLMHRLAPEVARTHVQAALEEGTKEIRVAAIGCLGDDPEDLTFLLEQSKSKAKDVRAAAYRGLSRLSADPAIKSLIATLGGSDLEIAIPSLQTNRSPAVLTALLAAAQLQANKLLASKETDKAKTGKEVLRLTQLLQCLVRREDSATEKFFKDLLDQRIQWTAIKSTPSGVDVLEVASIVLASGSTSMKKALAARHADLPATCLGYAFVAACQSCKPDEVFKWFGPYLMAESATKKRGKDPLAEKANLIVEAICYGDRHRYNRIGDDIIMSLESFDIASSLSLKWLELAIKLQNEPLILELAQPGNKASNAALMNLCKSFVFSKSRDIHDFMPILDAMIRVRHPDAVDTYISVIEKFNKSATDFDYYWLFHSITDLPKEEAVPKLEALVARLPEKGTKRLIDQIFELKQK